MVDRQTEEIVRMHQNLADLACEMMKNEAERERCRLQRITPNMPFFRDSMVPIGGKRMKIAEFAKVFEIDFSVRFCRTDKDMRFEASIQTAAELVPDGVIDNVTVKNGCLVVTYHEREREPALGKRYLFDLGLGEEFFYLGEWYRKVNLTGAFADNVRCNQCAVMNLVRNDVGLFEGETVVEVRV